MNTTANIVYQRSHVGIVLILSNLLYFTLSNLFFYFYVLFLSRIGLSLYLDILQDQAVLVGVYYTEYSLECDDSALRVSNNLYVI